MKYTLSTADAVKLRSPCLIIPVYEDKTQAAVVRKLDQTTKGYISRLIKQGDITGKTGQSLMLHQVPGLACERLLLIGCGKAEDMTEARYRKALTQAMQALVSSGADKADNFLTTIQLNGRDWPWKVQQAIVASEEGLYEINHLKTKKNGRPPALKALSFAIPEGKAVAACKAALQQGVAIALGIKLTKDLGNLPGNICTPTYLAKQAQALAQGQKNLKVRVYNKPELEKMGMGALLAVARGSHEPPKFITMEYHGGRKGDRPIALVGKGITFDSGGISIKPSAAMDEMKFDMCGAASVLGTFKAVLELKLPINLVGIIPSTENLPGGSATKPGDIVTSLSGQTIEILNTDAEGRLILCDALTYTERYHPETVIDIATLTGACVIALGHHATGLLGNHAPLIQDLLRCGQESGDRAWQLPLWEEYQDQLKTNFADMANVGGREGGTITAACFLSRYTKKFHWAHLDIAGTAWRTGDKKGATGRPVALLMYYLLERSGITKRPPRPSA